MLKQKSTLAHINSDVTWEPSFLCAMKGGGPKEEVEEGYDWSALASFKRWIDSTAATRMSGRHWMYLINQ